MDKTELFKKLDIDIIEEFKYYENLAALLEEDDYIEENLIKDLIKDVDKVTLAECMDSYFDQFLEHLPDEETELYLIVDSIGREFAGLISEEMSAEDITALAEEISKFRKWYIHDLNVTDRITGSLINVRDARYNIVAARLLGEEFNYDFSDALKYSVEGYDIRVFE